jgi:dCTP diphosphatase
MERVSLQVKLGIDLIEAANKKVEVNKEKYPVDEVKGSAKKYSEYQ